MGIFRLLALAVAGAALLGAPAAAENHIFIVANSADGYGIDRCLANGEPCGVPVATAYCQSQSFVQAKSFRKVERDDITGAIPTSGKNACAGSCNSFVAIECAR